MYIILSFYISCHDASRVVEDIESGVWTVARKWAMTEELTATRVTVRSRK